MLLFGRRGEAGAKTGAASPLTQIRQRPAVLEWTSTSSARTAWKGALSERVAAPGCGSDFLSNGLRLSQLQDFSCVDRSVGMADDLEAVVRAFFDDEFVAGLLLPDGWFGGRPMEGHHQLTFVAARPKRLLIELDEQLLLSFSGSPTVRRTRSRLALADGTGTLVISGFRQCVLEYLEYVNDTPHMVSYQEGDACLVAPT